MASVFLEITWFQLNVLEVLQKSVLVACGISPRLDQKSFIAVPETSIFRGHRHHRIM